MWDMEAQIVCVQHHLKKNIIVMFYNEASAGKSADLNNKSLYVLAPVLQLLKSTTIWLFKCVCIVWK